MGFTYDPEADAIDIVRQINQGQAARSPALRCAISRSRRTQSSLYWTALKASWASSSSARLVSSLREVLDRAERPDRRVFIAQARHFSVAGQARSGGSRDVGAESDVDLVAVVVGPA